MQKHCREGLLNATKRQWRELRSYICLRSSSVYPSLQQLCILSELSSFHTSRNLSAKRRSMGMVLHWKLLSLISRIFRDITSYSFGGHVSLVRLTSTFFFCHTKRMQTLRRRRKVLRNENVLYLVTLNAVADFLFIRTIFIYFNVVLSFYCSVWKLKWCDVKDPTVVKLRLIAELWAGKFIPPCIHSIRSFRFRLIFAVVVEHFTFVNVKMSEKMLTYGTTPCHVEQYTHSASGLDQKCNYRKKFVVHCILFWTEPRLDSNLSLAQNF